MKINNVAFYITCNLIRRSEKVTLFRKPLCDINKVDMNNSCHVVLSSMLFS